MRAFRRLGIRQRCCELVFNTNHLAVNLEELAWRCATTFLGIAIGCIFIDEVTAVYAFLACYCLCMGVSKYFRGLVLNTNCTCPCKWPYDGNCPWCTEEENEDV
jgi:hypothetical protein